MTLGSLPNPSSAGEQVTLLGSVRDAAALPLTGTVTFFDGTNALGNAALDAGGFATFLTTNLPPGLRTISARFLGNASAEPSAAILNPPQLVLAPPATTGGGTGGTAGGTGDTTGGTGGAGGRSR